MPGRHRIPTPTILEGPPDALLGTLQLTPVLDAAGRTVDRLVTGSAGTGTTLLFGDVRFARGRRLSDLDAMQLEFVHDLLGRVGTAGAVTVELVLAERRMLLHVSMDAAQLITIMFARVDRPVPPIETDAVRRVARLRTMMSCLRDGVALYEPLRGSDGAIEDFRCVEMSDADPLLPAEEQIGQRLLVLFPEAADNGTFEGYVQAIETGAPWSPQPLLYERGGDLHRYRITAQPIDDLLVVSWRDTLVDPEELDHAGGGEPLTTRQTEILQAIAAGRSTADIAGALFLSPFTVRNEVRRILAKLGVRSRAEAVRVAASKRLIDVDLSTPS